MSESQKAKIVIIVAPSGTGKTTLISRIMDDFPALHWSVSATTRPMREGEIDGKDYHFISKEEFITRRDEGEFVEWFEVHSNYYGTSKRVIADSLSKGIFVLCDIDTQGADAIKAAFGTDAHAIFISPPSVEELKNRLVGRATDSMEVIEERVNNARHEMTKKDSYDELVINDDLEQAYIDLKKVFTKIMENEVA